MTTLSDTNECTSDREREPVTHAGMDVRPAPAAVESIRAILTQLQAQTGYELRHYQTTAHTGSPYGMDFWQAVADLLTDVQQCHAREAHLQVQADVLQHVGEAVIAIDQEGRILYLNAAAAGQYDVDPVTAVGQPLSHAYRNKWLQPEDEDMAAAALAERGFWRGETRHIKRNGTAINVELTLSVLRDRGGNAAGVVAHVRRIPTREPAEARLQADELPYRQLADAMPHLVWTANATGVVDYYNIRIYDYDPVVWQSPAGFDWQCFLHPDDLARTLATWQIAVERGEPYSCEHRLRMADGRWRWHLSRAVPQRTVDNRVRWYGTATDIHERKLAEEALQQSNTMLNAVLESTSDAIFVRDRVGQYLLVNTAGAAQVKLVKEALIGQRYTDLFSPVEVAAMSRDDRPVLEQGLTQTLEHVTEHDGVRRYWHTLKMPLRNAQGEIVGLISSARDFTERKQMEEALRASEARFRHLADAIPQIIWNTDEAGQIEYINAQWLTYSGMTFAESLVQERWPAVHPDDLAANQTAWERAIATGTTYEAEVRLRRTDGVYRWFLERAVPIRDVQGLIRHWVGASMDIHDRKEAEIILRRYQLLSDQARDIILFLRLDGQIVEANAAAVEVYGYARMTLLTMTIHDLRDPATHPLLADQMTQANQAAGRGIRFETVHRRQDGTLFPVEVSSIGADMGNERLLLSVIRDISQHKAAEAALAASEAKFATAFNLSPLILAITTLADGRLIEVNEGFVRTTGYTRAEALGRTPDELGLWANPQERVTRLAQVKAGEWVTDAEVVFRLKNGELRTCLFGAALMMINDQPCILTALTDITARKRAEERLHFLTEASTLLASSLDYTVTLGNVAHAAVPRIADGCVIDLVAEDGSLQAGIVAHVDPAKVRWAEGLRERYLLVSNTLLGAPQVIRTGQAKFYPEITDVMLQAVAKDAEELGLLRSVGYRSAMIVPLKTHGRILGALTFVATAQERHFDADDLTMAEELAQRAAAAIGNAQLHHAAQHREQALRRSEERLRLATEAGKIGIYDHICLPIAPFFLTFIRQSLACA